MMEFIAVDQLSRENLATLEADYVMSFPLDERRSWDELTKPRANGQLYALRVDGRCVGCLYLWHLTSILFVEYLLITPRERGHGFGGQALCLLSVQYPNLPIVLECEGETMSPMAARRLQFYRRLGFVILPVAYVQPALSLTSSPLPLHLLMLKPSYCPPLSYAQSEKLIQLIYEQVYASVMGLSVNNHLFNRTRYEEL